ncbi:MAG: polyphenol oxidase family protein, partial [Stellaceae bacterium]
MISLDSLDANGGIRHGFFTRRGGVSEGLFESLNCGFGSGDAAERVARNRAIAMDALGLAADRLLTCRQIHSATIVTVETPWRREEAPAADGMVSRVPGLALGVLTADCAPVLL